MRIDEKELINAMDRRLASLDSCNIRRDCIRQQIIREEPVVRKKLTIGLVFALVALFALTSVALAVGINLFEFFGDGNSRYAEIAPETKLATETPVTVDSEPLGTTNATINSAYYDGKSLLVGYIIENNNHIEAFTPTDEQLSQMVKQEDVPAPSLSDSPVLAQYNEAVQSGKPFGYMSYTIYPSDHTETDDGIDLPPVTENEEVLPDGTLYVIREYENPLPAEVQDRDLLNIQIRLWQSTHGIYFDGTDYYLLLGEQKQAGVMTANIQRTVLGEKNFSGNGILGSLNISADATVSAVHASVVFTADGDGFPPLNNNDSWNYVIVVDESNKQLRCASAGLDASNKLVATFEGTGKMPQRLTAYILVSTEGDWDEEAAMKEATPIELTVKN